MLNSRSIPKTIYGLSIITNVLRIPKSVFFCAKPTLKILYSAGNCNFGWQCDLYSYSFVVGRFCVCGASIDSKSVLVAENG